MIKKIVYIFIVLNSAYFQAQNFDPLVTNDAEAQIKWVDTLLNTMTIDEKIGQLFMVQAYSNKDKKHSDYIEELIDSNLPRYYHN